MTYRFLPGLVFSMACLTSAQAQRDLKEIPSTDPAVEQATFKLAPGMEINLFAQEPMIAKPIQMAWDEKGRLWVASSAIYPHIKPGQEQSDKILILEDTDGDGKADKSTTFFEGLIIPTGILPGDGGAYVANSTELLFMKDTNGDGRADETKVLLSGFGTEDTHHILHGFRRGHDGCVYVIQSVYIHAHIETPFGVRRLMGSGIWQFRPETGRLEVFSMGLVNPWGHVFDKWGQSFATDGAGGEGINFSFPGSTAVCIPNQRARILRGMNPGQPKQCGLEVISGRHFPDDWQGDLITNDFRGHRVNRFKLTDQGSGYSSKQMEDVIASNHGSFRPVDVKLGPDGALYIADWYNPIIQHGEVDFRDERRDHTNGRIWRLSATGRAKSPRVDYEKSSMDQLLGLLKEPEQWVRLEAKQEIVARIKKDPAILEEPAEAMLARVMEGVAPDSEAMTHLNVELAWLAQSIHGGLAGTDNARPMKWLASGIHTLAKSSDPRARAVGTRLAGMMILHDGAKLDGREEAAAKLATDANARVRLEAINTLRFAGTAKAVELACLALDHPMDEYLDFALWLTCSELADVWLPAFQKGEITFGGNVAHIAYALKAANKPEAVGALLTMVQEGKVTGDRVKDVIGIVGALGSAADLRKMADMIHGGVLQPQAATVLNALAGAARQRQVLLPGDTAPLLDFLRAAGETGATEHADIATAAVNLAGAMKLSAVLPSLKALTKSSTAGLSTQAVKALAEIGGDDAKAFLFQLAKDQADPAAKAATLAALTGLDPAGSATAAADFLCSLAAPAAATGVLDAFLARKDGPAILAAALKDRKLPAPIATAGVQRASAAGGDTKVLIEALTTAGGLQPVMALTPEQMSAMMAEVKTAGDPVRGEAIYRRAAQQCMVCHAIAAVGGIVGPDLVSIGASAPVDYIIDSLLEPSKKIKEGYATTMLTTKDGGVHSGFLVRADEREVILRDAAGTTTSIPAGTVAKQESIPVSLMPPGLTATLRRDEFVDLVRFLSELGKEGGYKVQEDGTLRRWQALNSSEQLWRALNELGNRGLNTDDARFTWTPVFSKVDGTLPLAELPTAQVGDNKFHAVQTTLNVQTAGELGLRLNDTTGVKLLINDKEVAPAAEVKFAAAAGRLRITLLTDSTRTQPLRLQTFVPSGSPVSAKAAP